MCEVLPYTIRLISSILITRIDVSHRYNNRLFNAVTTLQKEWIQDEEHQRMAILQICIHPKTFAKWKHFHAAAAVLFSLSLLLM